MVSRSDVISFRWLPSFNIVTQIKQGDNLYISQQTIANKAVMLAYVNITLGYRGGSVAVSYGQELHGTHVEQALQLTKYLNNLRSTDIMTLQRSNPDGSALESTLQQGNLLLQKANLTVAALQQTINTEESNLLICNKKKSNSDDVYNQALNSYNGTVIEQATTQAQEASACIAQSQVQINSLQGVLNNLTYEIKKTQEYIGIIQEHKSLLIDYGSLIPTSIPNQLIELQRTLNNL